MTEKKQTRGDRFPLLVYQRWGKMLRTPSLLIAIASFVTWWFIPPDEGLDGVAWALLAIGAIGLIIFFYALLARRAAYVQCTSQYLKIRTPLMPVAISYARILQVRPNDFNQQFSRGDLKSSQRRLVEPFFGKTVLVMELKAFPMKERSLRLWLNRFMFATNVTGFVLLVEDWMALSRQISMHLDQWVARRQQKTGRRDERQDRLRQIIGH